MPGGLKQSASKEEFLKAVNLNLSDASDKQRFTALWLEVTSYWNRHFETDDRHNLKPEYASNATVTRPYKWAHFNPAFIDHAIREIWQNTNSTSSRYYYDLGASDDKRVYNWVLKWLLWHVCRYRDWRNRKKQPGGKTIKLDPSGFGNGDGHDNAEPWSWPAFERSVDKSVSGSGSGGGGGAGGDGRSDGKREQQ